MRPRVQIERAQVRVEAGNKEFTKSEIGCILSVEQGAREKLHTGLQGCFCHVLNP